MSLQLNIIINLQIIQVSKGSHCFSMHYIIASIDVLFIFLSHIESGIIIMWSSGCTCIGSKYRLTGHVGELVDAMIPLSCKLVMTPKGHLSDAFYGGMQKFLKL